MKITASLLAAFFLSILLFTIKTQKRRIDTLKFQHVRDSLVIDSLNDRLVAVDTSAWIEVHSQIKSDQ